MSNYVGIQGQNILIVSSDPSNPTEGQIWYNSTSNTLKGFAYNPTGTWSTQGNLNTARQYMSGGAGAGTQTAALTFGGSNSTPSAISATESFNGSSWTTLPANLNTARLWNLGLGGQTTALVIGGYTGAADSNATEKWNGTSWTTTGNLNTARRVITGFGSQTACIAADGAAPRKNNSESFNGTSWTNLPNTNLTAEGRGATAASPQTSGIIFGGAQIPDSPSTAVESWNGSAWTTLPTSMNVARRYFGGVGSGPTDAFAYAGGGSPGSTALSSSESYNGTSWTTGGSMSVARRTVGNAASGTTSAAATWGGDNGSTILSPSSTEIFNKGFITKTITAS